MTSYELTKHLQSLLEATGPDRALVRYLFVLAKGYDALALELMETLQAKSRTLFSAKQQASLEKFTELRRQADIFPLGQIFHETIELQSVLKRVVEAFDSDENSFFNEMNRSLAEFYSVFERLVRHPTKEAFASLLPEASSLYTVVVSSRQFFTTVRNALHVRGKGGVDSDRLSLIFENTSAFDAIVKKMGALQGGYAELAKLAGVSAEEHPLRVVKIEAGNLWICVEGEPRVIGLFTALIQRFALFWYHRVGSSEGEGASSERVTATQSLVNLADELERAGIKKVSPDAAEIREPALVLRRVLLDLLEHEQVLRVNEKLYSVDGGAASAYLDEVRPVAAPARKPAPQPLDIQRLAHEIASAAAR